MSKEMYSKDYIAMLDETGSFEEYVFFDHLKNREIIINQQVDDSLVERAIMQILKWNKEDAEIPKNQPINIYLNSPGGDLYGGMVLAEVIQKSKIPVHGYLLGLSASMGGLLAIAFHKTFAYEHSNILLHDGSTFLQGSSNKVKDTIRFQEAKDDQVKRFVVDNTNITEEKYDSMSDREWWMTAQQAKEYGIVDEIL
ncbi:ClpP family protease [Virgibacillus profundi]|nr:ATP-dependent Clp protease proteolytic subunit [Virgibacillus profundi]